MANLKFGEKELIFNTFKIGEPIGFNVTGLQYRCNFWHPKEKRKFEGHYSEFKTLKSEVYEGEQYLCFTDKYRVVTGLDTYFMISKKELIKHGIVI